MSTCPESTANSVSKPGSVSSADCPSPRCRRSKYARPAWGVPGGRIGPSVPLGFSLGVRARIRAGMAASLSRLAPSAGLVNNEMSWPGGPTSPVRGRRSSLRSGPRPACPSPTAAAAAENAPGVRCTQIRYAFQPDCFEPPCPPAKRLLGNRLDLGPQVAVWVEQADRSRFIDTLMVTNLTARFGVGNRPGRWDLPSGPRHPYGKRLQVLPIWAWTRGRLYPRVIMQDDHEEWMGFHEQSSSPDPYYCRPMGLAEIDVDAITCPTKVFNSAKGKLVGDMPMVPYPPRNDLTAFTAKDCDMVGGGTGCPTSASGFGTLNDLDAVAAATPAFERVYEGTWQVARRTGGQRRLRPGGGGEPGVRSERHLPAEGLRGRDVDPQRVHPDRPRQQPGAALGDLPRAVPAGRHDAASASTGQHRRLRVGRRHQRIGARSGQQHLPGPRARARGGCAPSLRPGPTARRHRGKLFVRVDCGESSGGGEACSPLPAAPPPVTDMVVVNPAATSATIEFRHPDPGAAALVGYEIRRHPGIEATEQNFLEGVPVPRVDVGPPGSMTSFQLTDLKPLTPYVVAVRVVGSCGTQSPLTQVRFTTLDQQFQQLTGCFVATAAHGSALDPGGRQPAAGARQGPGRQPAGRRGHRSLRALQPARWRRPCAAAIPPGRWCGSCWRRWCRCPG